MSLGGNADNEIEREKPDGDAPPDSVTPVLAMTGLLFLDVQQMRVACTLRAGRLENPLAARVAADTAAVLLKQEQALSRKLKTFLRKHPLYPWLKRFKGLAGPRVAILLGIINNPHRFPGQQCAMGHHHLPTFPVGSPCPMVSSVDPERICGAPMQPPRTTTGVRSLWHYWGLHADEHGKSPRRRKGQQADWNPIARMLILGPNGIADQIVKHRPVIYGVKYEQQKDRLQSRAALSEESHVSARRVGQAAQSGTASVDASDGNDQADGRRAIFKPKGADMVIGSDGAVGALRPFQIDALAKKIAAKAFLGDALMEWKRVEPLPT